MTNETLTISSPLSGETINISNNEIIDWLIRTVFPSFGCIASIGAFDELGVYPALPEYTGLDQHGSITAWDHMDKLPPRVIEHLEERLIHDEQCALKGDFCGYTHIAQDLRWFEFRTAVWVGTRRFVYHERIFGPATGRKFFDLNPESKKVLLSAGLPEKLGEIFVASIESFELSCLIDGYNELIWELCFEALQAGGPWTVERFKELVTNPRLWSEPNKYLKHHETLPFNRKIGSPHRTSIEYLNNQQVAQRLRGLRTKLRNEQAKELPDDAQLEKIQLRIQDYEGEQVARKLERQLLSGI